MPLNAAQKEKTGRRALRSIRERRVVFQITENRRQQPAEIFVNKILAQAKPRFCAGAPNLRGSARAGKVKAVRVLQWCALKKRTAEENSGCSAKGGQRGCPQITAFRRRQLAEERVNLISQKRKNDTFSFFPL